jgi:hypothetical protein
MIIVIIIVGVVIIRPVRLDVDVSCDLPQGQSNEALMGIYEEQRSEEIDVAMRGGKPRGCADAIRK